MKHLSQYEPSSWMEVILGPILSFVYVRYTQSTKIVHFLKSALTCPFHAMENSCPFDEIGKQI